MFQLGKEVENGVGVVMCEWQWRNDDGVGDEVCMALEKITHTRRDIANEGEDIAGMIDMT